MKVKLSSTTYIHTLSANERMSVYENIVFIEVCDISQTKNAFYVFSQDKFIIIPSVGKVRLKNLSPAMLDNMF